MVELPRDAEIGEENLVEDQGKIRALMVSRLEMIWETILPHVDGTNAAAGLRVDPRMVEAGVRVLDRLARLYRLDRPLAAVEPGAGAAAVSDREAALASLAAIEARAAEAPGSDGRPAA